MSTLFATKPPLYDGAGQEAGVVPNSDEAATTLPSRPRYYPMLSLTAYTDTTHLVYCLHRIATIAAFFLPMFSLINGHHTRGAPFPLSPTVTPTKNTTTLPNIPLCGGLHAGSSLTRAHKPASQSSSHLHNPTQSNSPSSPPYTSPQSPQHPVHHAPSPHFPMISRRVSQAPSQQLQELQILPPTLRLRLLRQLYPRAPPLLRFSCSQLQPPLEPAAEEHHQHHWQQRRCLLGPLAHVAHVRPIPPPYGWQAPGPPSPRNDPRRMSESGISRLHQGTGSMPILAL